MPFIPPVSEFVNHVSCTPPRLPPYVKTNVMAGHRCFNLFLHAHWNLVLFLSSLCNIIQRYQRYKIFSWLFLQLSSFGPLECSLSDFFPLSVILLSVVKRGTLCGYENMYHHHLFVYSLFVAAGPNEFKPVQVRASITFLCLM